MLQQCLNSGIFTMFIGKLSMNTKKNENDRGNSICVIKKCLKIYLFFFLISKVCQLNFMLLSCNELWLSNFLNFK